MTMISRISIVIFIIVTGLPLVTFVLYIRPSRFVTNINPADLGLRYETVRFTTADGLNLAGWFIPAQTTSDKVIILCHGYPADKNNILSTTSFLAEQFNLFYFDFRYLGGSDGGYSSLGYYEQNDLNASVQWVKDRGFSKIGAYGFSMGAATIILTQPPEISAIAADSPFAGIDYLLNDIYAVFPGFSRYPFIWLTKVYTRLFLGFSTKNVTPVAVIGDIRIPLLLIHSKQDSQIPVSHALRLYEASNKDTTTLWIIEGADHGMAHFQNKTTYEKRVMEFFEHNIP